MTKVVFLLAPQLHLLDLAGRHRRFRPRPTSARTTPCATWASGKTSRPRRACRCGTLTRLFGQTIRMTPLRYQQLLRVERAEHLIGHGATVDAAARAVGFEDARMLRRLRARG